jgi:uncharacterized protein with von Willebrand factor type A (vWA) domain
MTSTTITERLILFSGFLKRHGFKVFSSDVKDCLCSLEEIGIAEREDFFNVLRTNLVTTDMEWRLFRELFDSFWNEIEEELEEERADSPQERMCGGDHLEEFFGEAAKRQDSTPEACFEKQSLEGATFSPVSCVEKKDISHFDKGDIQVAQLLLKRMISPFQTVFTRRYRRSKRKADLDFRRVFRKSLKSGGVPLELFYKKKRERLKRLIILADVSGSMDRYARFVMPFIMGLKGIGSKAEVFVFSTSLTPITSIIRRLTIHEALDRIAQEVPDWSGGTRIGHSLHQFNERYGERCLNRRAVVVIMSDGWDLGGTELLRREMESLKQRAHSVIWLNPLAGDSDYRPVCQGMRTALPYVDYFLPADSLQSLKRVGRTLSKVMIHS